MIGTSPNLPLKDEHNTQITNTGEGGENISPKTSPRSPKTSPETSPSTPSKTNAKSISPESSPSTSRISSSERKSSYTPSPLSVSSSTSSLLKKGGSSIIRTEKPKVINEIIRGHRKSKSISAQNDSSNRPVYNPFRPSSKELSLCKDLISYFDRFNCYLYDNIKEKVASKFNGFFFFFTSLFFFFIIIFS